MEEPGESAHARICVATEISQVSQVLVLIIVIIIINVAWPAGAVEWLQQHGHCG